MNKNWKIFGFSVLGIAVVAYLSFLFVLPNVVDVNKYKPEIQKTDFLGSLFFYMNCDGFYGAKNDSLLDIFV